MGDGCKGLGAHAGGPVQREGHHRPNIPSGCLCSVCRALPPLHCITCHRSELRAYVEGSEQPAFQLLTKLQQKWTSLWAVYWMMLTKLWHRMPWKAVSNTLVIEYCYAIPAKLHSRIIMLLKVLIISEAPSGQQSSTRAYCRKAGVSSRHPLTACHMGTQRGSSALPLEPGVRLSRPSTALSFAPASSWAASSAAGGASSAGDPAPAGDLHVKQPIKACYTVQASNRGRGCKEEDQQGEPSAKSLHTCKNPAR